MQARTTPDVDRFDRLARILEDAPIGDASDRRAHIRAACGDDDWLYTNAIELLQQEQLVPPGFLAPPRQARRGRELPETIGPYEILRQIDDGGMGDVFEGRHEAEGRHVAIKVVRTGLTSQEASRRFAAEGRMLSQMNHPGIAQVYAVSQTYDGEPYIAMELVPRPIAITDYAWSRQLDLRARVAMVADVCEAVHHAHQRGIIHRDLKPANIVVSGEREARAHPRVIDFGVAKLIDDAAITDLKTRVGQLLGTREYMAPEQARDPAAAEVRSDVYSLGVVLHELLTGVGAVARSGGRRPEPAPELDLDLRHIIDKATSEDVDWRYASADALGLDLRRFLQDEPVEARPPSTRYRLGKFVRRHRTAVAAASLAIMLLAATTAVAVSQAVRATSAEAAAFRSAYASTLAAAAAALEDADGTSARQRLDEAPIALRGWEWRHLRARTDTSARTMDDVGGSTMHVRRVAPNALVARSYFGDPQWIDLESGRRTGLDIGTPGSKSPFVIGPNWIAGVDEGRIEIASVRDPAAIRVITPPFNVQALATVGDTIVAAGIGGVMASFDPVGDQWCSLVMLEDWTEVTPKMRLELSRDRRFVLCASGSRCSVFERATGRRVWEYVGEWGQTTFARLAPGGDRVALVRDVDTVIEVDLTTGSIVRTFGGIPSSPRCLAYDLDGSRLGIGCQNGALYVVHDYDRRLPVPRLGHAQRIYTISFDAIDSFWTASLDRTIRRWELDDPFAPIARHSQGERAMDVSFIDESTVIGAFRSGALRWSIEEPSVSDVASGPEIPCQSTTWAEGRGIAVLGASGELVVWDGSDGSQPRGWSLEAASPLDALEVGPSGRRLALSEFSGVVRVVDITTFEVLVEHAGSASDVAWLSDDELVSAGRHGEIIALGADADTRRLVHDLQESLTSIAVTRDGRRIIVGSYRGPITILDARDGSVVMTLEGHSRLVSGLEAHPTEPRLASCCANGIVNIWDLERGTHLARFDSKGNVQDIAWSPSGEVLAIAGPSGIEVRRAGPAD